MDAPTSGFAEEEDHQQCIDQKHIPYHVILFLTTVTFGLFSTVSGADDAPLRPVMGKGESNAATGAADGGAIPNFHSPNLVVSRNPRNTVGVACPDAIVVLNL